jgi:hypothetical protein
MRSLADLTCAECGRSYFGDLRVGHGLFYPMLLEKATGKVHDAYGVWYFEDWLTTSYAARVSTPRPIEIVQTRQLMRPVLLNCLDLRYGHSLLKLLNAQHYIDHEPDLDLVVLVTKSMAWLVPEGVAATWTVDLPFADGKEWNDDLAERLRALVDDLPPTAISEANPQPHPDDYQIERFTRVAPFDRARWDDSDRKLVTFIWREDRFWPEAEPHRERRVAGARRDAAATQSALARQVRHVIALAKELSKRVPTARFAVAGLGTPGGLPAWIEDKRSKQPDVDVERGWCGLYAESHAVVGIHGSNMLLPSAHAGAVLDLMPDDRWGNHVQDLLIRADDVREALVYYQTIPASTTPARCAAILQHFLFETSELLDHMAPAFRPAEGSRV